MTTPRSRSVPRYATLAPANSPPRITPFPRVGLRKGLVEVRSDDGDMLDALALLGEKTRVDVSPSSGSISSHAPGRPWRRQGARSAQGADRTGEILRSAGVELVSLPRSNPVVVDVPPHRRLEIAHDDPEWQCLVEDRLARRPIAEPACRRRAPREVCERRLRVGRRIRTHRRGSRRGDSGTRSPADRAARRWRPPCVR
jgi:hypothetical protein